MTVQLTPVDGVDDDDDDGDDDSDEMMIDIYDCDMHGVYWHSVWGCSLYVDGLYWGRSFRVMLCILITSMDNPGITYPFYLPVCR